MNEAALSIIIPCHNSATFITPCLKTVLLQKNILGILREVIFICDSCSDNTKQVIQNFIIEHPIDFNVRILDGNYGCPGLSRNAGIEESKGTYIWFIDSDDWLTNENAIDILIERISKEKLDILEFKIKSPVCSEGKFGGGTVWRAILSRKIIRNLRFNDFQLGEDSNFAGKVWQKAKNRGTYGQIDLPIYFYNYPREGSQMNKFFMKKENNTIIQ